MCFLIGSLAVCIEYLILTWSFGILCMYVNFSGSFHYQDQFSDPVAGNISWYLHVQYIEHPCGQWTRRLFREGQLEVMWFIIGNSKFGVLNTWFHPSITFEESFINNPRDSLAETEVKCFCQQISLSYR